MKVLIANEPWGYPYPDEPPEFFPKYSPEFFYDNFNNSDKYQIYTRPYRIWHEYLKLSPTFALAIEENKYKTKKDYKEFSLHNSSKLLNNVSDNFLDHSKLTIDQQKIIPKDFDIVVKTFWNITKGDRKFLSTRFEDWFHSYGMDAFESRPPSAVSISNYRSPSDIDEIMKRLHNFSRIRSTYNGIGIALIAVPLVGKKSDLLASIDDLIKAKDLKQLKIKKNVLYKIQTGKQIAKLHIGLRVLITAALNPTLELWRVGYLAGVTKNKQYKKLNIYQSEQSKDLKELPAKLATMTSKRLREAMIIMENAARGQFPCNKPDSTLNLEKDEMLNLVLESIKRRESLGEFKIIELKDNET